MQIFHRHIFWQKITETHQSSIGKLCIAYLWWKLCKLLLKSWYKSTSAKMEKTDTKTIRATAGMSASYSGRDAPYVFTYGRRIPYSVVWLKLLCCLFEGKDGWESELLSNYLNYVVMFSKSWTFSPKSLVLFSRSTLRVVISSLYFKNDKQGSRCMFSRTLIVSGCALFNDCAFPIVLY